MPQERICKQERRPPFLSVGQNEADRFSTVERGPDQTRGMDVHAVELIVSKRESELPLLNEVFEQGIVTFSQPSKASFDPGPPHPSLQACH